MNTSESNAQSDPKMLQSPRPRPEAKAPDDTPETTERSDNVLGETVQSHRLERASNLGAKLITGEDILSTWLALNILPYSLMPSRHWPRMAAGISEFVQRFPFFRARAKRFAQFVPDAVTEASGLSREEVAENFYRQFLISQFEVQRASLRLFKPPSVKLRGAERLDAALKAGKGAILWVEQGFSSSLMTKMVLDGAGYRLHHISRRNHGGSNTRYGIKVLAGIIRHTEDPYLEERILLSSSSQVVAMRRALELLKKGEIVTITVIDTAAQVVEVPALGGTLSLATGAPHLSRTSRAALFPVWSYREGESYIVEIGRQIDARGGSKDEGLKSAATQYAEQLTEYVQKHPLDWAGWYSGAYRKAKDPESPT